jgi:LmbE family N-acetylglucosaminyl deacetylase
MTNTLRLLAVLAHPDDESMGNGGMLARYAAEGVETYLITATRGEQGWFGAPEDNPGTETLGRIRETELRAAAAVLGIREVTFLDYRDGELDQADQRHVESEIAHHIRRIRPDVVVTFDPTGFYGHPDHIAICRLTTGAVHTAANPAFETAGDYMPHFVPKLYYMAWTVQHVTIYHEAFGELSMEVGGETRSSSPWPAWAITTRIDAGEHWRQAWAAVACHRTQLPGYRELLGLPEERHRDLWGTQLYYRVFGPCDNCGGQEKDLFSGLRHRAGALPMERIAQAV